MSRSDPVIPPTLGLAAGIAGVFAAGPLPGWAVGMLLVAFILLGPGCALASWVPIPSPAVWLVVPAIGISVWLLAATVMAELAIWDPQLGLLAIAAPTVTASAARLAVAGARWMRSVRT
ncbi:hypothetical protein [Homoserinibacter sp. GY 40078]|uniref:hypothetical protein n=1 Tax=Homoserinibacter sp. GY 40078 TaxID=2603275 RepID=UPI0011CAC540|nr:hypothetical protein [Homoserinibacter sp. GY 40078]TXK17099.1 hypothetical protein FVQ89_09485 [Homoserinibacter sp. GY 40078]